MKTIRKLTNKKAQMEIMGLVVIVILVALGMLFAIKYFAFKEPSDTKQKFVYEEQTSNMLAAMLKTNICKGKETIESLLIDCAEGEAIICNNGKTSCQEANDTIESIILGTLEGPWNQNYQFTVKKDGTPITQFPKSGVDLCYERAKKAAVQPLPLRTGTMVIKLNICSKV
jgi:hypothetical protein